MLRLTRLLIRLTFLVLVMAMAVSLSLGNQEHLTISLPPFSLAFEMPTYLLVGLVFMLGISAGIVSSILYYHRKLFTLKRELRLLKKNNAAQQQYVRATQTEATATIQLQRNMTPTPHVS